MIFRQDRRPDFRRGGASLLVGEQFRQRPEKIIQRRAAVRRPVGPRPPAVRAGRRLDDRTQTRKLPRGE